MTMMMPNALAFMHYMGANGHKFLRTDGEKPTYYWYKPKEGIYKAALTNADEWRSYVNGCPLINEVYRKSTQRQNALLPQFKAIVEVVDDWAKLQFSTTHRKLAFEW